MSVMSTKAKGNNVIALGPTGAAVARNIKTWRQRLGLSYTALEKRTEENGRRIPAISIRRVESETRRVDVDELITFAFALETTPAELLDGGESGLTGVPKRFTIEEEHRWVTAHLSDLSPFTLVKYWEQQEANARKELSEAQAKLEEVREGKRHSGIVDWSERVERLKQRVAYAQDMADNRTGGIDG